MAVVPHFPPSMNGGRPRPERREEHPQVVGVTLKVVYLTIGNADGH